MSSLNGLFQLFQSVNRKVNAIYKRTKVSDRRERNSIGWIFPIVSAIYGHIWQRDEASKTKKDVGNVIKLIYWNLTVSAIQRHKILFASNFSLIWVISAIRERSNQFSFWVRFIYKENVFVATGHGQRHLRYNLFIYLAGQSEDEYLVCAGATWKERPTAISRQPTHWRFSTKESQHRSDEM